MSVISLYWDLLDEAHRKDTKFATRIAKRNRKMYDPFNDMSDEMFTKTYCLTKTLVRDLVLELTPIMHKVKRSDSINIERKVLMTLGFYVNGSCQTQTGGSIYHSVSQSAVSRNLREVHKAFNNPLIFNKYVRFPESKETRKDITLGFKIPGVVGCIGDTNVAIVRPTQDEEKYCNSKGYHSLKVQIICNSNLEILNVDTNNSGNLEDSTVWKYINSLHNDGEEICLLGGKGYPLEPTIMTPIMDEPLTMPKMHYNNMISTTQELMEKCIEVLKARFRCLLLQKTLYYNPVIAGHIVNACCVLHNIANKAGLPTPRLTPEERDIEREREVIPTWNPSSNYNIETGKIVQEKLVEKLWVDFNS